MDTNIKEREQKVTQEADVWVLHYKPSIIFTAGLLVCLPPPRPS